MWINKMHFFSRALVFVVLVSMFVVQAATIKVGWVYRLPYSYQTNTYNVNQLKGLDIDFVYALAKRLNMSLSFFQLNESDIDTALATGGVDVVVGSAQGHSKNSVESIPYRKETYVLYLKPDSKEYFYNLDDVLKYITPQNPLGVVEFRKHASELREFLQKPENQKKLYVLGAEGDLLEEFLRGSVNAFIGDRVVFSTLLHRLHKWRKVQEMNLGLQHNIVVAISKQSPLYKKLDVINTTIADMQKGEELDQILTQYLTPAVLMHTIDEGWLRFIELLGVVAFTLYAFIHGFYRHMAFVKTIGFSMIMVFTGPVLKDVLTTGQIEFFRNQYYLSIVIGIIVAAHAYLSILRSFSYKQIRTFIFSENKDKWILEIACAVGLASYTVSGVLYAITSVDNGWFWQGMLGTITATAGLLLAHKLYRLNSQINFLFSEISLGWAIILTLYFTLSRSTIDFDQESIFIAVIIVFFGIFFSRMMALYHEVSSIGFGRRLRETIDKL